MSSAVVGFVIASVQVASAQQAPTVVTSQAASPLGWIIDLVFSPFNPSSGLAQSIFAWVGQYVPGIFLLVAVVEMMYFLANSVLTGSGNEGMYREMFGKLFRISIAFIFVQHAGDIITAFYNYVGINLGQQFATTAAQAMGSTVSVATPNVSSPGTIVESGIGLAFSLLFPQGGTSQAVMAALGQGPVAGLVMPMFFLVVFSGVPPAFMLAMTWVKFTVSAYGTILLVFLPSRVTQGIANGVMHLFTTLAVQTLAITGWCGLMAGFCVLIEQKLSVAGQTAHSALQQAGSDLMSLNIAGAAQSLAQAAALPLETWVYATIGICTLSVISLFIPKIAEGWITGTPSLSFGDALRLAGTAVAAAVLPAAALAGAAGSLAMIGGGAGAAAAAAGGSGGGGNPNLPSSGNSISGSGGGGGGTSGGGFGPFSPGMVRAAAVASNIGQPAAGTLRDMSAHFEPARGSVHLNAGV